MPDRPVTDFGERLRRARDSRGVSLRQVANVTRITVRALEAVERNDLLRLPGGIFTRSFVRAYAAEVGLDPEGTLREFLAQCPEEATAIPTSEPSTIDGMGRDGPGVVGRTCACASACGRHSAAGASRRRSVRSDPLGLNRVAQAQV
jgi:transcriptional regulator with XRE-family HTH domain